MKLSKPQFGVLIHKRIVEDVAAPVFRRVIERRKRPTSRTGMTVGIALIGLLAGWIAGIALIGRSHNTGSAAETFVDEAAPSPSQVIARPPVNVVVQTAKPAQPREARAESQESQDAEPSLKKEGDDKQAQNEIVEAPNRTQSTKEAHLAALEKIIKETEKMKREKAQRANKNEN